MLNIDSVLLSDSVCYRRLVITLAVSELLNYASLLEFTLELLECFFYVFTLFNWYYNHDLLIILVLLLILILDFRGAKICNLFYSTKFSVPFTKNNPPFLLFYVVLCCFIFFQEEPQLAPPCLPRDPQSLSALSWSPLHLRSQYQCPLPRRASPASARCTD